MVAVAPRARLQRLEIRSGPGLGHGDGRDDVAADHARQIAMLLRFGAVDLDIVGDDVALQRNRRRGTGIGQFLPDDRIVEEVGAEPAIFRRHGRTEQSLGPAGLPEGPIDDALPLEPVEMGQ